MWLSVALTFDGCMPMALDGSSVSTGPVRPHCSEVQTIQVDGFGSSEVRGVGRRAAASASALDGVD